MRSGPIFVNSAHSIAIDPADKRRFFMANHDQTSSLQNGPGSPRRGGAEGAILTCCALAWVGLSISILLVQQHAGLPTLFCPVKASCETVLSSKYASLIGVPLPWLGVAIYSLLLLLLLGAYGSSRMTARSRLMGGAQWISVMGASASAVLMFIQFGVLHAFCPLCTASAATLISLAVASGMAEGRVMDPAFPGRPMAALALAVFTSIPAVVQLLPRAAVKGDVLAVVDGQKFTREQMEDELGASLQPLQQSMYELELAWVRRKVDGALLAAETARTKTDATAVLAARLASVKAPADEAIAARLSSKGLPDTSDNVTRVKEELLEESREQERVTYMEELARGHRIAVLLEQPKVRALEIDLTKAKFIGPRDAKVQLVVFSDFQCEFCKGLSTVLKKIRADFPNDVMLAYRYFPVESHARAVPAAIAAECAAEQGAFWEYHDKLYAEGGDLGDARLASIATELKLDSQKFEDCQKSYRARAAVDASRADAAASGLEGVPALFLNGRRVAGAIDYELLASRVRQVLESPVPPNR